MKLDMHIHSKYSSDGKASARQILKRARKMALGGICITDHNTLRGSFAARKIAPEFGLLAIRGMEISSSGGHILGVGIQEEVPRDLSPEETLERIRELGGIAIIPHPFRRGTGLGADAVKRIRPDAIEALNSHSIGKDNEMARRLCKDMKLPMTAGSDAHELGMLGRAFIVIQDVSTEEEALSAICSGKARALGNSRQPLGALKDRTITVVNWVGRGFRNM